MGKTWVWIIQLVAPIFMKLIELMSPVIKTELNAFATQIYLKALATENPWDDLALGFLLDILAIPRPPPQ